MNNHTQTPWIANGKYTSDTTDTLAEMFCVNRADTREVIAATFSRDNRDTIVRACNAHSELVTLLEDAIATIDACDDPESRHWLGQARAALIKAKG